MIFGRLKVIKKLEKRLNEQIVWLCECQNDGNIIEVRSQPLRSGRALSCGCRRRENVSLAKKKYNKYNLNEKYGIGYTFKGEEFYFDLDDYELIKIYCWCKSTTDGYFYAYSPITKKLVTLHSLIMNFPDNLIDHKDRNKNNNKKDNLRLASNSDNCRNVSIRKDNKTGIIGVSHRLYKRDKNRESWVASITINGKNNHILESSNYTEVVKARLLAEKQYFGEFAPQKHLYREYGIE